MSPSALQYQVTAALRACEEKKAHDIAVLQMEKGSGVFTDYFLICSGANPRQVQAIADEVKDRLQIAGLDPTHTEGYSQAEWILLDYVDFVVHIFNDKARRFYDLERLWKSARRLSPAEVLRVERRKPAARRKPASKAAPRTPVRRRRAASSSRNHRRAGKRSRS